METVFETHINQEDQLTQARNKIKELEEKIKCLECDIKDKSETISGIENNMSSQYVENWTCTDMNGKRGEFSGNMYWIKGEGMIFNKNKTIFEGSWDSTGEIIEGELRGIYSNELLSKWENGEEVDLDDESN
jgi:hypothetical protein